MLLSVHDIIKVVCCIFWTALCIPKEQGIAFSSAKCLKTRLNLQFVPEGPRFLKVFTACADLVCGMEVIPAQDVS